MQMTFARMSAVAVAGLLAGALGAAQERVTTPRQQFGFDLGDDYQLANYRQIADYWRKLDAESERGDMTLTAAQSSCWRMSCLP